MDVCAAVAVLTATVMTSPDTNEAIATALCATPELPEIDIVQNETPFLRIWQEIVFELPGAVPRLM